MTRAGRACAAAAGTLVLALALACAPGTLPPPPPAPVRDAWPGCVAAGAFAGDPFGGPPQAEVGSVPDGFSAQAAVWCRQEMRPDARGRELLTDVERTSTAIGPLLTYLARPSEEPTDGACAAVGIGRPWLFLLDPRGRHVAPAIPTDACGLPLGWQDEQPAWAAVPYADRVLRPSATG